jgi:hypothetical protein
MAYARAPSLHPTLWNQDTNLEYEYETKFRRSEIKNVRSPGRQPGKKTEQIAHPLQLAKEGREKEGERGHMTDPTTQRG